MTFCSVSELASFIQTSFMEKILDKSSNLLSLHRLIPLSIDHSRCGEMQNIVASSDNFHWKTGPQSGKWQLVRMEMILQHHKLRNCRPHLCHFKRYRLVLCPSHTGRIHKADSSIGALNRLELYYSMDTAMKSQCFPKAVMCSWLCSSAPSFEGPTFPRRSASALMCGPLAKGKEQMLALLNTFWTFTLSVITSTLSLVVF